MANKKDVDEVKTEKTEKTEKVEEDVTVKKPEFTQVIFVGNSIKGFFKKNTIYKNGIPADEVKRTAERFNISESLIKALIVPIEDCNKAIEEVNTPDSRLYLLNEEIQNKTK